mgnify:CR=1
MKKLYVSPHSEVIEMEAGHLLCASGSSNCTTTEIKIKFDYDTKTDEQH